MRPRRCGSGTRYRATLSGRESADPGSTVVGLSRAAQAGRCGGRGGLRAARANRISKLGASAEYAQRHRSMTEPAALPGLKLKAERERRGLSAQKAADEMRLDRWVIDALEADDYQRIGPTVYAKGHLKKYAALLGLPAAEILAGFESRAPSRAAPAAAGPSMLLSSRDDASSSGQLSPLQIAACVAVVLALGVLWWRPWHTRAKAQSAPAVAAAPKALPADKPIAPSRLDRNFLRETWRASRPAPMASCAAIRAPIKRTVRRRAARVRPADRRAS